MNNSAHSQRTKIINRLREGSLSTLEARRELDTMHPAARIMELRKRGFDIRTVWTIEAGDFGIEHRIARYCLLPQGHITPC